MYERIRENAKGLLVTILGHFSKSLSTHLSSSSVELRLERKTCQTRICEDNSRLE